jgi:HD domain
MAGSCRPSPRRPTPRSRPPGCTVAWSAPDLGTAEALAAALEAKDAYKSDDARSTADLAEAVGRRLGMGDADLHDLRLAAVFHDIGKIAVPDWILNKPRPLTDDERAVMERRTIVGEQILAPVEFSRACARSCGTSTSAGMAAATRTGWPARRSRSVPASSWPVTHCTP